MGERELFGAGLLLWSLLLLASMAEALSDAGSDSSGGGSHETWEWQILTKKNFSSQIRRNPRILLMVTVPWSGESRSLRKELRYLVADRKEEFGSMKLMIVYMNSEKMLADLLGSTDEITLFYYHHSVSYKYNGRLRAQNVLSAIYYFLTLEHEEIPLKSLQTLEELQSFFLSTDKAVLLLEFCGWTAKLLNRQNNGNDGTPLTSQNHSKNVVKDGRFLTREEAGTLQIEYNKVKENELICRVDDALPAFPYMERYSWENQNASVESENIHAEFGMSCSNEEFQKFESFFTKFIATAREYFLPPERQRFGLISEKSLLSFLGVGIPDKWLVMLNFSGCPNCLTIIHEGDDLKNILQTHKPPVMEVDDDGNNLEPAFPANRPSVILFIDRSSDSSKVRGESKLALEILRKFARENQRSYEMNSLSNGVLTDTSLEKASLSSWSRTLSSPRSHQIRSDPQTSKIVQIKENMAFMLLNEGDPSSLTDSDPENQDNIYNLLTRLLQHKNPPLRTKETKISSIAKEVGFELLSDDFEVQVVDSFPLKNDNDPQNGAVNSDKVMLKDYEIKPFSGLSEDTINRNDNRLVDTASDDMKQTEPAVVPNTETVQEASSGDVGDIDGSSTYSKVLKSTRISKVEENYLACEEESGFSSWHDQNDHLAEQDSPTSEMHKQQEFANYVDCGSDILACANPSGRGHSSSNHSFGNNRENIVRSVQLTSSDALHSLSRPFVGSFFFSDGDYQLLKGLTGGSRIPSLVILDPIQQQHYTFPSEVEIGLYSLVNFINRFLNDSLTPYQRSAIGVGTSRELPRPPFVNLDFHELDCVPQVTSNTFCEVVIGIKSCEAKTSMLFPMSENFGSAWKVDVLVLFTASWCGFCQRMELILREVYRSFRSSANSLSSQFKSSDALQIKEEKEEVLDELPSIVLMDCTHNDCGLMLKTFGKKEEYPLLLLFPAENKSAITYGGDMSVVSLFEFLESHGRNSHYLHKHKGYLWSGSRMGSESGVGSHVSTLSVSEKPDSAEDGSIKVTSDTTIGADSSNAVESYESINSDSVGIHIVVGSILLATDKLLNAVPFQNSTVLLVSADKDHGFQGVIINKRISWDIFKEINRNLESLRHTPLFYGGPVRLETLPLVSLSRKATNGYSKVAEDVYYGNPVATGLIIQKIKSGEVSTDDYWFFLGFSSWGTSQLFYELEEGAWQLIADPVQHLDWPELDVNK